MPRPRQQVLWVAPQRAVPEAAAWLKALPDLVASTDPQGDIYHGRNRLLRSPSPWGEVVIKAFRVPKPLQAVGYAWRSSKALRSLINGLILQRLGIPTPQPIATVEERAGWRLYRSWYICAYFPSVRTIREDLWESTEASRKRFDVCGALCGRMHNHGILHDDFSPGNILFAADDAPSIVDINRMRHGRVSAFRGASSLARMYARGNNLQIFCAAYARERGLSALAVWRYCTMAHRWLRIQRSARKIFRPSRW